MNVNGIYDLLMPGTAGTDRSLVVRADQEFNLTLRLGQVLKGKVLRHYEGSRYGVDFGGQERVVDSTSPLRVGDMLRGRVVAIDDKVHLQRLVDSALETATPGQTPATGSLRDEISALFARYQVQLSEAQHQALRKLVARLGGSQLVAPSALILHKLGLPQDPVLVRAIHQVLMQGRTGGAAFNAEAGPQMSAANSSGTVDAVVAQELAPLLARLSDQVADVAVESGRGDESQPSLADGDTQARHDDRERDLWQLGQWLLNTQGEGSLAHRYLRFPLWIEDRLIEVSMALYSQQNRHGDSAPQAGELRHHKAVFSLATDNLGEVEIEALVAGRHLRLTVSVERQSAAERLAEYLSTLTAALDASDWQVDEIRYRSSDELTGVMQSVVEHHVTPDSLSRLM